MGKKLPKIYDITYFDESGNAMNKDTRSLIPLDPEVENEVQFMAMQKAIGAASYSVHLMDHNEIRSRLKEQQQSLRRRVTVQITETLRVRETVMQMAEMERYSAQPTN